VKGRSVAGLRAVMAALALLLCAVSVAGAQGRLEVRPEPGTPVVAMEILVAAGPANESAGKAGLAYLAARTVTAPVVPALDSLGAHLEVAAAKDALSFTLIAAPDAWEEASRILLVALFRDAPDAGAMIRQQAEIAAELAARETNPADAALRATDAAVFGANHPWGRSTVGTPQSVRQLGVTDVDEFLRGHVTSQRAVIAVVGPVDRAATQRHLRTFFDPATSLPAQDWSAPSPARGVVRREYNSITTWVQVSYPFAADADVEALEFLARLTLDELAFSPLRRSVFNARSEVIPRRAGGELRFQVVAPPAEAPAWPQRIRALVEEESVEPMVPELFQLRLRRYRGERLSSLATPEARARELARQLLVSGETRAPGEDVEALSVTRLRAAARALGNPTVVLLGPAMNP
jgi:predicted Zn-dependent peptidase